MATSTRLSFFNDPSPPHIYTLSLHDALPILKTSPAVAAFAPVPSAPTWRTPPSRSRSWRAWSRFGGALACTSRSEEHTSELQSRRDLVCRLLLEKKKFMVERASSTVERSGAG